MSRRGSPVDGITDNELIARALKAVVHFNWYRAGEWRLARTPVQGF